MEWKYREPWWAHFNEIERDRMVSELLTPESIAEGKEAALKNKWHAMYVTSGDTMIVVIFYLNEYDRTISYQVYDCQINRRSAVERQT